jgi:Phage T7 tail fibre protein
MTYAPNTATGNGVTTDFAFDFPYLDEAHVKVTLDNSLTTAYTFFSTNVLRFTSAPGNGVAIKIFRETPNDELDTIIQTGSSIPVDGLNNNFYQSLYYSQETAYTATNNGLVLYDPPALIVRDQKASGTNGGTFTSGAWRTRDLNTILTNTIPGAGLSANQITLPPGTYGIDAFATSYDVGINRIRIKSITGTAVDQVGPTIGGTSAAAFQALLSSGFVLASTTSLELQHRCFSTKALEGWDTEICASVKIIKVS